MVALGDTTVIYALGMYVAPPDGFEPSTNWLTARRSTGLSYGGNSPNKILRNIIKIYTLVNTK